jgi:hypothetical protein
MISKTGAKRLTKSMKWVIGRMQDDFKVEYLHVSERHRICFQYIPYKTIKNLLEQGYITGDTPNKEIIFELTDKGKAVKL